MPSPSQVEKSLMVVESFISVMDNREEFPSYNISDGAVMDWFGRSICGRTSILRFAKTQIPNCQHKVDEVCRIPRVSHRLLNHSTKHEVKKCTSKQGNSTESNSGRRTPENPICPNLEELVKAPNGKKRHWTVNSTDLEFVEIKGSLQYEQTFCDGTTSHLLKTNLKEIVLGYSDEINFIEYRGVTSARRVKLFL